jgi:hypothetical protein
MKRGLVVIVVVTLFVSCATAAALVRDTPVIRSPADHQQIGEPGDPLCPPGEAPCFKIQVEGWVPRQRAAFFAVEPLQVSPRMWIQAPVRVSSDGSATGLVQLGERDNGAGQLFRIFLFACADPNRFHQGDEPRELPKDCEVSAPIQVLRVR